MGMCALYEGVRCQLSRFDSGGQLAPDAESGRLQPASSPMAVTRRSRVGLVVPSIAHGSNLAMLHGELAKLMRMSMREHVVEQRANDQPPTVMVIDDDPGVRDSLGKLLRSAGFRVSLLGSVSEFLATDQPEGPACLVLDVRLPGQSGLELQRELAGAKR